MTFATKVFDAAAQELFARISGDTNPMHMDAVAARRTQMGAPVVHGMHVLLWALDSFCAKEARSLNRVRVSFTAPVHVGTEASVAIVRQTEVEVRLQVSVGEIPAATIVAGLGQVGNPGDALNDAPVRDSGWPQQPLPLEAEEMGQQSGAFAFADPVTGGVRFKDLAAQISNERVSAIAALSRLVGMVCPGLHSIFHSLSINLVTLSEIGVMRYRATGFDDRFRMVRLAVAGGGIVGEVAALARIPPVRQPGMDEIAAAVPAGFCRDATVLVIGGSRGLGEVVAKVCAVGGARIILTYSVGGEDASDVAEEIRGAGGLCDVMRLDVSSDVAAQLSLLPVAPTHVYYFATGHISGRPAGLLDGAILDKFMRFYVEAFGEVCEAIALQTKAARVFYPSSVFVDEVPKGFAEYAVAKSAGEGFCRYMNQNQKGIRISVHRLPRMLTDQTATVASQSSTSALEVMAPLIRDFHATA
jgi:NAD(P)-dependent dehydrogenase (short-subunit alcohol dehydrogenase family)